MKETVTLSPMIKKLAHVCALSADLQKTEDFYCGVLGLKKKFDFQREGRLFGFYLEVADHQYIEFFQTSEANREKGNLLTHLCLEIEDMTEFTKHLEGHGVKFTEPKLGADQSWQTWCTDPDGVAIEFHQYTPESSQHTGKLCVVDW